MPILIFFGNEPPVRVVDAYEKFLEDFHPTYIAKSKEDSEEEPFEFTTSPIM